MNQRGQSTVEYLLLLAVVISIALTVLNSRRFKDLVGNNGRFAQAIKQETEWNYRNGLPGKQLGPIQISYPRGTHPTYYNQRTGTSRFIGPLRKYPAN